MRIAIFLLLIAMVLIAAAYGLWYLAKHPKPRSSASEGGVSVPPPPGFNG